MRRLFVAASFLLAVCSCEAGNPTESNSDASSRASPPLDRALQRVVDQWKSETFVQCSDGTHFRVDAWEEGHTANLTFSSLEEMPLSQADRLNGLERRVRMRYSGDAGRRRHHGNVYVRVGEWSEWTDHYPNGTVQFERRNGVWTSSGETPPLAPPSYQLCCGPAAIIACSD